MLDRIAEWLETHWATPAYAGWLLGAIAVCFFGAATNTMAGWLYVISGIIFAMLGLAGVMPARSLRHLKVRRLPIPPVTAGDKFTVEIELSHPTKHKVALLQVQDVLPYVLGKPVQTAVETLPNGVYRWVYYQPTQKRGVYRWHNVQIRTGAPLGLFWCRRNREVPAKAIVYPTVLPLTTCPMIDEIGREENAQVYSRDRRSRSATEGVTRTLRPYRLGDPTRLIHWRTSARYGEFKVRELEVFTSGQEIIICLDSAQMWREEDFEQAAIAAASLYFYASRCQLNARLWTAGTGIVWGNQVVLETLAAVGAGEDAVAGAPPSLPLIWLTQNPVSPNSLPAGSRFVLWTPTSSTSPALPVNRNLPGIVIDNSQPLQLQLQQPL